MKQLCAMVAFILASACTEVAAQSHQPYAGMEQRPIKALSAQQLEDLRLGRGMGLALAAELNGYPGPLHVLELADALALSPDQRAGVQNLFDSMRRETIPLGNKLIGQEKELDAQFAGRTVTAETLKAATAAIAMTQGELREGHLKYHLATAALLTPSQMQRYAELRGYAGHGNAHETHRPH